MFDAFSQAWIVLQSLLPRILPFLVLLLLLSVLPKFFVLLRSFCLDEIDFPEPKINRSKQISDLTYSEIENGSFDLDKSVALWADFYSEGGE